MDRRIHDLSRHLSPAIVLFLSVTALVGCAVEDNSSVIQPSPSGASTEQLGELEDETVTYDEYRGAYARFKACVEQSGFALVELDEVGRVQQYSFPASADAAVTVCYETEFEGVDTAWQIANEDESYTAEVVANCVVANGGAPTNSLEENLATLEELGVTVDQCEG